ncbi:AraC family transcriptional regulator [Aliarcobacter butzleri]|uniref:Transcriptional regulator n=1 Tax=Aliarcobacter butzleri (strain RM4018) TaxID=367737 RepID=A8ERN5_ALIB4|nr:helix-turn-helix domain-containing protein [Aliarcobacter butzleri]ABV66609.1 transcriptional regulator [Aliarcobacter butzleri RM4018]MCG3709762.1 AraC family transcriptional regulator [Aliarcobacter butzleri]MCT7547588.1 AraC family transcriptional regulator [Aliarcobacter butzleri]MDN5042938.1 AraC family transcriptional regulator [Aliarcobacter butzleri]MDN5105388.1 AraC family transcriptional regulator [Aliarcobacter butzleri]
MTKYYLKDLISSNLNSKKNIIKNSFPLEIGTDYMEKIYIQDGFLFSKTNYNIEKPIFLEAKQEERKFVITISLKGNTTYINSGDKKIIPFKEGFTTISLFENTQGFREFKDKQINQIRLILSESFLRRNFQKSLVEKYFFNKQNLQLIDFRLTSIQSQFLLNDILNCSLVGELANIYKQGKIFELLSLEISKLQKNEDDIFLDDYDRSAILKAKEILLNNLQNPPSIVGLAKMVHLSEVKLKRGFKQIYKTSPYQLLVSHKMNLAKNMLESGEYNINEIALQVGYKFANNFTNAFYKEFKIRPKDILKK